MDLLASLGLGFATALEPMNILYCFIGVLLGTLLGERMLLGLSPRRFGQIVGAAIGLLGIWLLTVALSPQG